MNNFYNQLSLFDSIEYSLTTSNMNESQKNNNLITKKSQRKPSSGSKKVKVIREFFNHLSDPDFPYFSKLILLTALTHMNSKLDDKAVDALLVLNQKGVLKMSTEEFRTKYKKHKKAFESIGLSCELRDKNDNGANKTGTVKKIVFSFTREAKEKYLASRSYAYLRADYVTWFKTIVTKYLKNSDSVSSFFTLSILLSYWNTTEIINLDIKKLAVSIGLKSMIENRRQTLIKTTITKYLEYLKQEGLIIDSKVVKQSQIQIRLSSNPGYVYLIREEKTKFYKIGSTRTSVQKRLASLQVSNPRELVLVATIPSQDCRTLEKELHQHYVNCRGKGEWFEFLEKTANDFSFVANRLENTINKINR